MLILVLSRVWLKLRASIMFESEILVNLIYSNDPFSAYEGFSQELIS